MTPRRPTRWGRCIATATVSLCVFGGCVAGRDTTTAKRSAAVDVPATVAPAQGTDVRIRGQLMAHDGGTLERVEISLKAIGALEPVGSAAVSDGSFEFEVAPGAYELSVTAAGHRPERRGFVTAGHVEVVGRLTLAGSVPDPPHPSSRLTWSGLDAGVEAFVESKRASGTTANHEHSAGEPNERVASLMGIDLASKEDTQVPTLERMQNLLDRIDPADPSLAFADFSGAAYRALDASDDEDTAALQAWLERARQHNAVPDVSLRAALLLLDMSVEDGDWTREAALFEQTQSLRFQGMTLRDLISVKHSPQRPFRPGNQIPPFEFDSPVAGEAPVRSAGFEGKPYLLEFWATWCGPCVEDMEARHKSYARFGQDVEFIFVSLDSDPAAVVSFRSERWPMPWQNGILPAKDAKETLRRFGFTELPAAALVDADGTVVAVGQALRDGGLDRELQRLQTSASASPDR